MNISCGQIELKFYFFWQIIYTATNIFYLYLYISLRTTLCVRFKSEVVACGVVYAAARRHGVLLPEDPPWWTVFDADEAGIQEVCRVLAHLYSLPKAQYIPVYKDNDSFTVRRTSDTLSSKVNKEYNSK
jgi:hypothetical protein